MLARRLRRDLVERERDAAGVLDQYETVFSLCAILSSGLTAQLHQVPPVRKTLF
jgi:hypothetical protein